MHGVFHGQTPSSRAFHDVAQICLNGHVITAGYQRYPEYRKQHCDRCGAKTITECPTCHQAIQGDHVDPDAIIFVPGGFRAPAYCHSCGNPFPWTEQRLDALVELTKESASLAEDRDDLGTLVPDLLANTPRSELAATRWRKALAKVEENIAPALRSLLTEIATEAVKKMLFPGL